MKTLITLLSIIGPATSFAAGPLLTCESKENTLVKIQMEQQTPFGKNKTITINGETYHAVSHQNLNMRGEAVQTVVNCISKNKIENCSYADQNMGFIDITYQDNEDGEVRLKSLKSRQLNLNIECVKSDLIWE